MADRSYTMDLGALDGPQIDPADELGPRKPIVRHNLHDAIVSRVRDMIIEGTLSPGMRIHEGHLGQELGVSRTPLRDIRRMHDEMMQRYAVRDRLSYFKLNQNIHSAILKASGNDPLCDVHGVLQARLRRIRYVGNESPEKWAAAVADHENMIAALETRDGERLASVLANHMKNTWDRVRDSL
jgi:DNA-binding GntR family transcriptional regulator